MTIPLIVQIQQAAQDSMSSVTDALRKAKIACVKLGLTEFGNWVELELNGYIGKKLHELPEYRKPYGIPQAFLQYNDAAENIVSHVVAMNAEQWPEAVSHLEEHLALFDKVIEKCEHEVRPIHDAVNG